MERKRKRKPLFSNNLALLVEKRSRKKRNFDQPLSGDIGRIRRLQMKKRIPRNQRKPPKKR